MTFFAILFALLIEQVRPLSYNTPIHTSMRSWAAWVERNFDAGKPFHGWVVWSLSTCLPALAAVGIYWLIAFATATPVAIIWSIAVLYVTLGFRQFSHHFTDIRDALDDGNEEAARQLLARWQHVDASELPRSEILRHVIEYSVLAAHRHVFGVIACFCIFSIFGAGPAGAVLYRLAEFVARYWKRRIGPDGHPASPALQAAAARAWLVIDWLPARITALSFAVVGSFEEAIDGWRHHVQRFRNDNDGVILAATSGAINVRLGGAELKPVVPANVDLSEEEIDFASESTPGRNAEMGHLKSVVGLVWRSVVMWMTLLALLSLARLAG